VGGHNKIDPAELRGFMASVENYKRLNGCSDAVAAEKFGVNQSTIWRRRQTLQRLFEEEPEPGVAAHEAEANGREVDEDALRKEASVSVRKRCDRLEARTAELEAEVARVTAENEQLRSENKCLREFAADVLVEALARGGEVKVRVGERT
jgi:hypothetical protein